MVKGYDVSDYSFGDFRERSDDGTCDCFAQSTLSE